MKLKLNIIKFTKQNISKSSHNPGVYLFLNSNNKVIYVGKAINLANRLKSYLSLHLEPKTKKLIESTKHFSTIKVSTELEALLLEAKLISLHKPKYNIELKDDKRPLYIRITKEKYPRIILSRKRDLKSPSISYYGPFPSSLKIKYVLKRIRKAIPYCTHKLGKKPCLYSQMKLCNPCPNYIENVKDEDLKNILTKEYKSNIRKIKKIMDGKINSLKKGLEKKMKNFSKTKSFEKAGKLRDEIQKIDYITQPITNPSEFIKNPNLLSDIHNKELTDLKNILSPHIKIKKLHRIECYDIAHTAGSNPTASMVTFVDGQPENSLYRRFKIKKDKSASDTDSLNEVATRRQRHLDSWGRPDLVIVDGGKPQVSTFEEIFSKDKIPVVGLAKRFETIVIPIFHADKKFISIRLKDQPALHLVQRLRDEAHRFARAYHHKLFSNTLLNI
jgi:excinuclease ABC subunit C